MDACQELCLELIWCQHIGFCHNVAAVGWYKVFGNIEPAIVTHHWITDCQAAQQFVVKMGALPVGGRQQAASGAAILKQLWVRRLTEGLTICEGGVDLAQLCENLCNAL